MEWLHDLQRALRRDDDATREVAIKVCEYQCICLSYHLISSSTYIYTSSPSVFQTSPHNRTQLGKLKVVESKLIPLLIECRDDLELVVTLIKLFVMLTMPLSPMVKKWARLEVDPREADIRVDAIRRRNAARAQVTHLLAMKRAFVNAEVISVLVASMEEPLSQAGSRSDEDKLVIELVLTLFRNVLCIDDFW